ncbi:N-acyl-D-amino-acid deacylase [Bacillus thermophilus]|uniref:N-acyl-D-amino-acid deacylase n=1 Tax=Siminovitchia thermophila TaxID=1245522 RepID=A0ABS2R806_9BACI|nr:D-aminoacylase [Siminovitchia thermophila]MBM7715778.1 N-acyl-D-amino-acid deacylase [Siminovitchia thermophila]ONK23563.1 N-acyl-D-amino-acid deacylase [Bacillus sp. VT-16-64]
MLDVLIKNGEIIDGTGKKRYKADIGIVQDKIVELGFNITQKAGITINASGRIVAPGFIDIHGNSEWTLPENNKGESKIRQGVTTEVQGHCGFSAAPVLEKNRDNLLSYLSNTAILDEKARQEWNWPSQHEFINQKIGANGIPFNIAPLVGHGTIKVGVMGFDKHPPAPSQMKQMLDLLKYELEQGLFGMSSGLQYEPGFYTSEKELLELCSLIAAYDGIYTTHMRNEGRDVFKSIAESIEIARKTGVSLLITHLKLAHRPDWGRAQEALAMIDEARAAGVNVDFDLYPYSAYGSGLMDVIPPWAKEKGAIHMAQLLRDQAIREKVIEDMKREHAEWDNPMAGNSWEHVKVALLKTEKNRKYEGKNINEIASDMEVSPYEAVIRLLIEEQGGIKSIYFAMSKDDIRDFMKHPRAMLSSDGRAVAPYGILGRGAVHPRYYGTFPRILGRYVREKKIISLEEAIKRITFLPATKMKMNKRGIIQEGYYADITIFAEDEIIDVSTFDDPHRYSKGIDHVLVNGEIVIRGGKHTGQLPGKILSR